MANTGTPDKKEIKQVLKDAVKKHRDKLGLNESILFVGSLTAHEIAELLRIADLYVLSSALTVICTNRITPTSITGSISICTNRTTTTPDHFASGACHRQSTG